MYLMQIGPYEPHVAEWLTERTLDSKEHYANLERLFIGDISPGEFLFSLQFNTESLHASFQEWEREQIREVRMEVK